MIRTSAHGPAPGAGLFDRFVRGPDPDRRSGLGLGLYLVKRIIEDHHGNVFLLKTPASRFDIRVELPLANG